MYPPSLDFTVAFLACLRAGVVAVPVFPPNPARRDTLHMFATITESSGARYALTNNEYNHLKKMAGAKDAIMRLTRPLGGSNGTTTTKWPEALKWITTDGTTTSAAAATTTASTQRQLPTPTSADVAFLQYTSGSTSEPKGVVITHGNLAHNLTIITQELQAKQDTVVVSWLPQYHDMGLIGSYLGVIYCGGCGYYMSPLAFLQRPMLWIEAVSKHKATHLQAPNFAFKLTARKFQPADYVNKPLQLASIRHVINAAEPVDEDAILSFYNAFCPFGLKLGVIYPTYGLAEHTVFVCSGGTQRISVRKEQLEVDGVVVVVVADDGGGSPGSGLTRLVGCGFPARQGVDVRIVDSESRQEVGPGRVGEIWVDSPSKARGYYGKEDESAEDFHATILEDGGGSSGGSNPAVSVNGYLRTGDLGFLHNDELFICGRLKDLIIVAGRNYYPQDIEATAESVSANLLRPGCSAAFSVDPNTGVDGGEEVALVMELKDVPSGGGGSSEVSRVCDPLADQVRTAINREHSLGISKIVFVKAKTVPKTSSGKIARAWCRRGLLAGTLQSVYTKSFRGGASTFEVEGGGGEQSEDAAAAPGSGRGAGGSGSATAATGTAPLSADKIAELRATSRDEIMDKLRMDVARTAQIPPDSIDNDTALVTILDSLSISQFKGRLEVAYAVKVSDEYLFGETLTLKKLAEVVKLGYAPDDTAGAASGAAAGDETTLHHHGRHASPHGPSGTAGGLAGALGCPPGVRCVIQ